MRRKWISTLLMLTIGVGLLSGCGKAADGFRPNRGCHEAIKEVYQRISYGKISYGLEGGAQIAEVLREKGYDGVVFGEDLTAVGALNQWKKDGVKIPEEISLTGCNNSEYSYVCSPALTTVNNKGEVLSELTVRMLLDVLEKKKELASLIVLPELVVRETT